MSHDYEASWDYPVVELESLTDLSITEITQIKEVLDKAQSTQIASLMGFEEGFELFYVEPQGLTSFAGNAEVILGIYCNGTSSRPVIGVDIVSLKNACQQDELDLAHQLSVTLAHELAHAHQETLGHAHTEDGEDEAEAFGRHWADTGLVDLSMLQPGNQVESCRDG